MGIRPEKFDLSIRKLGVFPYFVERFYCERERFPKAPPLYGVDIVVALLIGKMTG
jgi:hypothetical protein